MFPGGGTRGRGGTEGGLAEGDGGGGGGGSGAVGSSLGFASFERFTNGIGSRLMGRMGWVEGMGLGRERQGRAEPVQAVKRPKGLGLGAGATGL